jgi:predicted nucleic acid-binding protein
MIVVDSSVWIDYFHDQVTEQTAWLEAAFGLRPIGLTNLILCEVLQGVRHRRRLRTATNQLTALPVFDLLGTGIAIASAENYRSLRSRGITVRATIDCLIATFCILEGHQLLHRDRDFDSFEEYLGLKVVKV